MRRQVSDGLVWLYARAIRTGLLDRAVPRRAFEFAYLAYKGLIEAGPINGLSGLVTNGSTVVDVGANIGFFSIRFARWVGPAGRVIAIEPEARNMESLRRRVARAELAGIVELVQAAAADRPGLLRLALNPGHPGDHHLAPEGEPVQAVTLDDLAAHDHRTVALIKIDAQGAETMVLAGARRVIETHRPAIYVEIDPVALARLGSSPRELIGTIVGLGYVGHSLTRRGIGAPEGPDRLVARSSAAYIDALFLPVALDPTTVVAAHRSGRWRSVITAPPPGL
jgi:FkbM family methyltransferase